jgi:hypothetical protein
LCRELDPPGRFLKEDDETNLWNVVSDEKAIQKANQALREKDPIRKQQEVEKQGLNEMDSDGGENIDNVSVNVFDFTWLLVERNFGRLGHFSHRLHLSVSVYFRLLMNIQEEGNGNHSSVESERFADGAHLEDRARSTGQIKQAPLARDHTLGQEVLEDGGELTVEGFSWQGPFENGSTLAKDTSTSYDYYKSDRLVEEQLASHSFSGPPTSVDTNTCMMDQPPHFRWTSNGGVESVGQYSSPGFPRNGYSPTPTPLLPHLTCEDRRNFYSYARYKSWGPAGPSAPSYQEYLPPLHNSGSWQLEPRWHSLAHNPRPNGSVNHPTSYAAFDNCSGSGYWPQHHGHDPNYNCNYPLISSPAYQYPPGDPPSSPHRLHSVCDDHSGGHANTVPKPDGVKRMTSNQNETLETRTDLVGVSVKRCSLNRDLSMVSNRLKAQYQDKCYSSEPEITQLSTDLENSDLGPSIPKPLPSKIEERAFTCDSLSIDSLRTIEDMALSLDDFDVCDAKRVQVGPVSVTEALLLGDMKENTPRPVVLHASDRLIRSDSLELFLEIFDDSNGKTMDEQVEMDKVLLIPDRLTATGRVTSADILEMINKPVWDS